MKILVIHNSYLERGGEDEYVESQIRLLKKNGHEVMLYSRLNKEIEEFKRLRRVWFFLKDIYYSKQTYEEVKSIIKDFQPDIAHIHNTFYVITPSVYDACHEAKVPSVQTFHNYRYLVDKLKKEELPEFNTSLDTKKKILRYTVIPRILKRIRRNKVFFEKVSHGIVLSEFSREIYSSKGFSAEKLSVVPPYIDVMSNDFRMDMPILFVGRLVDYKGIDIFLEAAERLDKYNFCVIGSGPLEKKVIQKADTLNNLQFLGQLSHREVISHMQQASCLVFPSLCYETFGQIVLEALACGVAVMASSETAAAELINEGKNGFVFKKGNTSDLITKLQVFMENPERIIETGAAARVKERNKFSSDKSYKALMEVYNSAIST